MSSSGPTSRTERNGTFRYSFLSFQNTCIALKQSKQFNPTVSPWVCLHFVSTLQSELNWLQSAVWTLTSQLSRLSLWQLMVRFLSVCLSAWHIYTPCVTINLLHYTHTHTHTQTLPPAVWLYNMLSENQHYVWSGLASESVTKSQQ